MKNELGNGKDNTKQLMDRTVEENAEKSGAAMPEWKETMQVIDVRIVHMNEWALRVVFDVPYEERSHCWEYSNVKPPVPCGPFGRRLAAYIKSSNVDEAKARINEFIEFWTKDNSCAQYELAQQTLFRVCEKLGHRLVWRIARADFRITDFKGFEYPLHPTDLALNVDELALRIERARTEWIESKAKEKEKRREHARNIRETAIALREYFHIKDKEKHRQEQIVPITPGATQHVIVENAN
jgi:hypothetical protein